MWIGIDMWPFKPTPKYEPMDYPEENPQVQAQVVTQGPIINPDTSDVYFAEYRADAIARCIEQRRAEGMDNHPDHTLLLSEAMSYAWKLVGAHKWTAEQAEALKNRIEG